MSRPSPKPTVFPNGIQGGVVATQVTTLTDNSGGTASDTIAVIGATYSQTEVANAVASLAEQINALTAQVNGLTGK